MLKSIGNGHHGASARHDRRTRARARHARQERAALAAAILDAGSKPTVARLARLCGVPRAMIILSRGSQPHAAIISTQH